MTSPKSIARELALRQPARRFQQRLDVWLACSFHTPCQNRGRRSIFQQRDPNLSPDSNICDQARALKLRRAPRLVEYSYDCRFGKDGATLQTRCYRRSERLATLGIVTCSQDGRSSRAAYEIDKAQRRSLLLWRERSAECVGIRIFNPVRRPLVNTAASPSRIQHVGNAAENAEGPAADVMRR